MSPSRNDSQIRPVAPPALLPGAGTPVERASALPDQTGGEQGGVASSSPSTMPIELACQRLVAWFPQRSVAVAFSGGVDSAVVAKGAFLALGPAAIAVTASSASLAAGELETAQQVAREIGIRHEVMQTDEFDTEGYRRNASNRCFYCKTELYTQIQARQPNWNFDMVVNGANADDVGDHRPGMVAAVQHGVRSPLLELGIDKSTVRQMAATWGIPVWDKPASPCLSSRIAYGVEVTAERVARIDAAEQFLRSEFGLRELRVRMEANDLARIEVPSPELPRLSANASKVVAAFKKIGFRYVTLDLEGFRSGSLNAVLPLADLVIAAKKHHPADS